MLNVSYFSWVLVQFFYKIYFIHLFIYLNWVELFIVKLLKFRTRRRSCRTLFATLTGGQVGSFGNISLANPFWNII